MLFFILTMLVLKFFTTVIMFAWVLSKIATIFFSFVFFIEFGKIVAITHIASGNIITIMYRTWGAYHGD